MDKDILSRLGISCNGPYIDDNRVRHNGSEVGIPAFVLLTGFVDRRVESTRKLENVLEVSVKNLHSYREIPEDVRQLRGLIDTAYRDVSEKGFLVFAYNPKDRSYLAVVPDQELAKEGVIGRFVSPPEEKSNSEQTFFLPLTERRGKLVQSGERDRNLDYRQITAFFDPAFKYNVFRQLIRAGGFFDGASDEVVSFYMPESFFTKNIHARSGRPRRYFLDKSFQGISVLYWIPARTNITKAAEGQAYKRMEEEIKDSKSANLSLSALPSELSPSPEQAKRWKPLQLSRQRQQNLINKMRRQPEKILS
ncbi:hypothetical protein HYU13_05675 [Candidatus Woesearchaeota archaeon]|nr:hypothetical protein [Candidatus Woesearchaeota archaeon]